MEIQFGEFHREFIKDFNWIHRKILEAFVISAFVGRRGDYQIEFLTNYKL